MYWHDAERCGSRCMRNVSNCIPNVMASHPNSLISLFSALDLTPFPSSIALIMYSLHCYITPRRNRILQRDRTEVEGLKSAFSLTRRFPLATVFCLLVVPVDNSQPHKKNLYFTPTRHMQQMRKSSLARRAGRSVQGKLTWNPMKVVCCETMRRHGPQKAQKAWDELLGGCTYSSHKRREACSLRSEWGAAHHITPLTNN
jgi:hypothetical protein